MSQQTPQPQVTLGCANRCGHTCQLPATMTADRYSQHLPVGWFTVIYSTHEGYKRESYVCSAECVRSFLRTVAMREGPVYSAN